MTQESESKDKPAEKTMAEIYEAIFQPSFTQQEYAAIHLKVPMSGTPWLDEMIEASRRDEFAKAVINGLISDHVVYGACIQEVKSMGLTASVGIAKAAFEQADALLAASKVKK